MANTVSIDSLISSLSLKDQDTDTLHEHDLTPEQWEKLNSSLALATLTTEEVNALVPLAQAIPKEYSGATPFISFQKIASLGLFSTFILFVGIIDRKNDYLFFQTFVGVQAHYLILGAPPPPRFVKGPRLGTKITVGGHTSAYRLPLPGQPSIDILVKGQEDTSSSIPALLAAQIGPRSYFKQFVLVKAAAVAKDT
ncbi:hypothetical protein ONZ45_g8031 [Pleurotus djamor]|nr:hypothetical protein ONZ45_g8031 [Pleurotus djamor]